MTSSQPSTAALPAVIRHYLDAQTAKDVTESLAAFAPDATVVDDGRTYSGTEEIRTWLGKAVSEYQYTTTLLSYDPPQAQRLP